MSVLRDFWFWSTLVMCALFLLAEWQMKRWVVFFRDVNDKIGEQLDEIKASRAPDFPGLAEMRAEQERLMAMQREMCHDQRCPGRHVLKHRCHDLTCKKHKHVSRAVS